MRGNVFDRVASERGEVAETDRALDACFDGGGFVARLLGRVGLLRYQSLATQKAEYTNTERLSNVVQIALGGCGEQFAPQMAVCISVEHGVGDDDVIVDVKVEASAEALGKADGSASQRSMRITQGDKTPPRADESLPAENFFDEEAPASAQSGGVLGENDAQVVGHREHPLTKAHRGEYCIDKTRRGVAHATRTAAGAHAATLARESQQEFVPTGGAHGAGEAVRMNAAFEIRAEFLFYVARDAGAIRPLALG